MEMEFSSVDGSSFGINLFSGNLVPAGEAVRSHKKRCLNIIVRKSQLCHRAKGWPWGNLLTHFLSAKMRNLGSRAVLPLRTSVLSIVLSPCPPPLVPQGLHELQTLAPACPSSLAGAGKPTLAFLYRFPHPPRLGRLSHTVPVAGGRRPKKPVSQAVRTGPASPTFH